MEKKFVISGALGDSVVGLTKILQYMFDHKLQDNDIAVHYIRDTIDIELSSQMLTNNYTEWVKQLIETNGFTFTTETGNQKEVYERIHKEEPETILLSPSHCYGNPRSWESKRELFYGERPYATEIICTKIPIDFIYKKIDFGFNNDKKTIGIQVRFLSENTNKVNSSWKDISQLIVVIKEIEKYDRFNICLIGETKQDIFNLEKKYKLCINASFIEAYNYVLSLDGFIGFNGAWTNLCMCDSIPTMFSYTNKIEMDCSVPKMAEPYITIWNENGKQEDLKEQIDKFIGQFN